MTYEEFFSGLAVCADTKADTKRTQLIERNEPSTEYPDLSPVDCVSTYDGKVFMEDASIPNGKKGDKPYSFSYSWGAAPSADTAG